MRPPAALDELQVDVAGVPVRIEIGARELGGNQRHAEFGRGPIELVDEAVLAVAQVEFAHRRVEIGRKAVPGVR